MVFSFFNKTSQETTIMHDAGDLQPVTVCVSNMSLHGENIYDELLNREDIELIEEGCTSNCRICDRSLFVIVNGKLIKARNEVSLLEKMDQALNGK
ncbi:DUF1450 domain-containing protein [Lysinibacillus sp. NPDC097287]|uniref:DUF1450 domain-containing protein n=1 Tax=Lysinibacillus sp. NPDC097287 TaxID=3364144 RepID=UPI0037F515C8